MDVPSVSLAEGALGVTASASPGTRVSDYDYEVATERIARYPTPHRDQSRLMVLGRHGTRADRAFGDIVELFRPGDLLVVNESKVLPTRLLGVKPTGAPAEVLLLRPRPGSASAGLLDPEGDDGSVGWGDPETARVWDALVRPGGKLRPGRRVEVADDLAIDILDSTEEGLRRVRLETPLAIHEALDRYGHVPLPPYIDRADEPQDRERYQTVYARTPGSVAAPTAGLHFTHELLDRMQARGVRRAAVTLHVGVGTFRPVDGPDPAEHTMHQEFFDVPEEVAAAVSETRAGGGHVWAVGTTVVRALETVAAEDGSIVPGGGVTRLFIRPPYRFRAVDGLITNFHLPRSTLLMLVAAFAGYERVMAAYREAVARGYRLYSYGDAMAIEPGAR